MWKVVAVDKINEAVTVAIDGSDHRVSVNVPAGLSEDQVQAHIAAAIGACLEKAAAPDRDDLVRLMAPAPLEVELLVEEDGA